MALSLSVAARCMTMADHNFAWSMGSDGHRERYEIKHPARPADEVAEECARFFHANMDGWEARWPVEIRVYSNDGRTLGTFEVERDLDPVFIARESSNG